MSAGRLAWLVQFRRASLVNDGFGMAETWADYGDPQWASKRDISDGERWRSGEVQSHASTRFAVRHNQFTAALTPRDRLVCDSVEYEIVGIKEGEKRRQWIEITAAVRTDATVLIVNTTLVAGTGSIVVSGVVPRIVGGSAEALPGTGLIDVIGVQPVAVAGVAADPDAGSVVVAGEAPTLVYGSVQVAGTGTVTVEGVAPVVQYAGATVVQAGTGGVSIEGVAPLAVLIQWLTDPIDETNETAAEFRIIGLPSGTAFDYEIDIAA